MIYVIGYFIFSELAPMILIIMIVKPNSAKTTSEKSFNLGHFEMESPLDRDRNDSISSTFSEADQPHRERLTSLWSKFKIVTTTTNFQNTSKLFNFKIYINSQRQQWKILLNARKSLWSKESRNWYKNSEESSFYLCF